MFLLERVMSSEERIRRAEEIYNRRKGSNNRGVRVSTNHVKTKTDYLLFKKLILQIAICLVVYFIFYLIKNSNYIFSEDVIQKTKEFLSYDINFGNMYQQVENFYHEKIEGFFILPENENTNQVVNEQTTNTEIINEVSSETGNEIIGIGGGSDDNTVVESEPVQQEEPTVPLTEMEIDSNYIKENYNLVLPLKGTVTSRYGSRTPTEIVSANHKGIDIGVNSGTVFVASMEGTVTMVSGEGDYRKSCLYTKW